jgi:hypothetical protein
MDDGEVNRHDHDVLCYKLQTLQDQQHMLISLVRRRRENLGEIRRQLVEQKRAIEHIKIYFILFFIFFMFFKFL